MPTTKEHIIIVNYDFPPNKGIGGRRWAKLAKAFAEKNYHVHVIKADSISDTETSVWTDDVRHKNIQVYSLPRKYPNILLSTPQNFLEKIQYRASLRSVLKKHQGTPYDVSLGWNHSLSEKLNEITKNHPVHWIFATGAPWEMLRACATFKEKFDCLKLWVDLRDPWLNARNYGITHLSELKQKEEEEKAKKVVEQATIISAPAQEIFEPFISKGWLSSSDKKLFHLRHFYSDKRMEIRKSPRNTQSIQLIYGGEIYLDTEKYFEEIAQDLDLLRKEYPKKYQELTIQIHSSSADKLQPIFKSHPTVQLSDSIGKSIERKISHAQWCVILLAEHNQDFFTTKYFEYQQFGVPYLFIGPDLSLVRKRIVEENRGTDWKNFFNHYLNGEAIDHTTFNQIVSEKDSVDYRVHEIEKIMIALK